MSLKHLFGVAVLAAVVAAGVARADDKAIDDEGFIRTWLVLAPIPLADGQEPADAVDKEQLKDEAKLEPKDGDKAKAGDKELTWKKHQAAEYFFDVHAAVGDRNDRSVAYAVACVEADADKAGVSLKIGSDDQCKVYLNGKEVVKSTDDRATDKDQNTADGLALKKGTNTIVFKVVNNGGEWSGCARFVDKDGAPVKGLTIKGAK